MSEVSTLIASSQAQGEKLSCIVTHQTEGRLPETGQVLQHSALGLCVEVPANSSFALGSQVTVRFRLGDNDSVIHGFVKTLNPLKTGLGLTIQQTKSQMAKRKEYRSARRWLCDKSYLPTGICTLPNSINNRLFFRALEVSKKGWTLITNAKASDIAEKQQLNTKIQMPTCGSYNIKFTVVHVGRRQVDGEVHTVIGVKVQKTSKSFLASLAQYLLRFCADATAKALYLEGLKTRSISEAMEFKTVETQQEYDDVLALRLHSYSQANKITEIDPKKVMSKRDNWENIFIAKHRENVVACVLLITPTGDESLEIEDDMGRRIDDVITSREEIVEITKLCTHPEYRGGDLIAGLFREMGVFCLENNRTTVICGTDDHLAPLYLKCGFKETHYDYTISRYGDLRHRCLSGDVINSVLGGKAVNPIIWAYLWKPVVEYFSHRNKSKMSIMQKCHLMAHRLITPLIRLIKA